MLQFPRTQAVFEDIASNVSYGIGQHACAEPRPALPGLVIGEDPYNPLIHAPEQINPMSFTGAATGAYYVEMSLPQRPLSIAVVEHRDPGEIADLNNNNNLLQQANYGRIALAQGIQKALVANLPGMTDQACRFVTGTPLASDVRDRNVTVIKDTTEPLAAAKAIAEICEGGLTYVIGSLRRLPFEKLDKKHLDTTVAVKANHLFDCCLVPGSGVWYTGHPDMREVNTDDPEQLGRWNAYLKALHIKRVEQLKKAGMQVTAVLLDPRIKPNGFSIKEADISIQNATRAIIEKR